MQMLVSYDWPGNVRELINVMEHATLLCQDSAIQPSDLPDIGKTVDSTRRDHSDHFDMPTTDWSQQPWRVVRDGVLRAAERNYLEILLRESSGRIAVTAARAGISVRSLSRKMRRSGLRKEDFRG
jgi:DNA-binding NtrC family response regulator